MKNINVDLGFIGGGDGLISLGPIKPTGIGEVKLSGLGLAKTPQELIGDNNEFYSIMSDGVDDINNAVENSERMPTTYTQIVRDLVKEYGGTEEDWRGVAKAMESCDKDGNGDILRSYDQFMIYDLIHARVKLIRARNGG